MGMTNAERQRQYRQRHLNDVGGKGARLNLVVDSQAKAMLERLSTCYGVTLREALALALHRTEGALLDTLSRPERGAYWTGNLSLRRNDDEAPSDDGKGANEPLRRNGNAADQDRDTHIIRLFSEGTSKRAIARELGISDGTVRNVLKRHPAP